MGSAAHFMGKRGMFQGMDRARTLLLIHAVVYAVLLASWVVELIVNSPTLDDTQTDKSGLALQVSAAVAAYGFVALSIYMVHSGVHLAMQYDTTLQVQSFAEGVDTGCRFYMQIALGCAIATAAIELSAPAYLSRSPEMQLCMHMLLFSSLFDMIMRNFWLPMMKKRASKAHAARMQPYLARLGPWFGFIFGAVAPLLSYFVDVRILFITAAMGFIGTPIVLFCVTVPMVYRKTVWLLKGRCCRSDVHRPVGAPHAPDESGCCKVAAALPNMYDVAPAPDMVKQGMRNTMQFFKWVIAIPIVLSCITGLAYVTMVARDGACLLSKLASDEHSSLLPRFMSSVGTAGHVCERDMSRLYWSVKHVLGFWFLFTSIAAICAMYCAHLLVHMHTVVSELQNMQQQAAGMLRFLSHECRSPLFVVLLILHNLIEADVPDVEDSLVRVAAGDPEAANKASAQLGGLSKQLTKMQKPLQLLRSVLDNMLSYLKLKQKRRMRSAGRMCIGEACPQGAVEGEEPMLLDAGAVMTEIGAMFPVLVDAMECQQPSLVSTFRVQCCQCSGCVALHPHKHISRHEGALSSLQCLPIWATVQDTTLKQALTNLLTNAVKYGGQGKSSADICVDVTLESAVCACSVPGSPFEESAPSLLHSQSSGASSGGLGGSLIIAPSGKALPSASPAAADACGPSTGHGHANHVAVSVHSPGHGAASGSASAVSGAGLGFMSVSSGPAALPADSSRAKLTITVSDSGKGLSEEERCLLFRPFERLRAGQQQQGTGLGLWLMHELLDFQGGVISVESEGLNKGCQFRITIPCFVENCVLGHLADSEDPGAALVSSAGNCPPPSSTAFSSSTRSDAGSLGTPEPFALGSDVKESPKRDHLPIVSPGGNAAMMQGMYPDVPVVEVLSGAPHSHMTHTGSSARMGTSSMQRGGPAVGEGSARPGLRRVLLVDDSKAVLQQLANALKRRGFKVTKAYDGQAALEKMQSAAEPFDLIVCDFEMPRMTGPELAAALREAGPAGSTSIGSLSSVATPPAASSGRTADCGAGADVSSIRLDSAAEPSDSASSGGPGLLSLSSAGGLPGLKRGTPTIFIGLTGNAMGADVRHFKQSGAHAVLIKPANPGTICTTATELQSAFVQGGHK